MLSQPARRNIHQRYDSEVARSKSFRNLSCLTSGEVGQNSQLQSELIAILRDIYIAPDTALRHALMRCDSCHFITDQTGILAFSFTAHESLSTWPVRALYCGLSGARQDLQYTGLIARLYFAAIENATEKSIHHEAGQHLYVWGLTAHPIIYRSVCRFLKNISPTNDGNYTRLAHTLLPFIHEKLQYSPKEVDCNVNPFVLPSSGSIYRSDMIKKLMSLSRSKGISIFDNLNINYASGDRIAFVGSLDQTGIPRRFE